MARTRSSDPSSALMARTRSSDVSDPNIKLFNHDSNSNIISPTRIRKLSLARLWTNKTLGLQWDQEGDKPLLLVGEKNTAMEAEKEDFPSTWFANS
jgi:hypothetical protein